ncbi:MAG: CPBP family intramembrane glutamic endopeptidase, partial [Bacteroidota bacterium]
RGRKDSVALHESHAVTLLFIPLTILAGIFLLPLVQTVALWNENLPIGGAFGEWAREKEEATRDLTLFLTQFESPQEFLFALFVMGVLAGVGEELLFRGLLQNQFRGIFGNVHVAILVSAILFSAIHMQFFGFFARLLLGIWFGYLYHWTRNLWIPILAHFIHNSVTLTAVYLYQLNTVETNLDSTEYPPLATILISMLISGGLIYFIWTRRPKPPQTHHHPNDHVQTPDDILG